MLQTLLSHLWRGLTCNTGTGLISLTEMTTFTWNTCEVFTFCISFVFLVWTWFHTLKCDQLWPLCFFCMYFISSMPVYRLHKYANDNGITQ